ncbi:MAG: DUF3363 domain-containing protein, partial [Sphingomicrobium sp.]
RTDLEIERRLRLEVDSERLTSIDRRLLREMDGARTLTPGGRDMFEHSLRTGRLRKLGSLGLADDLGGGRWRLARDIEPRLRELGEQGDIVRTMQRALKGAGVERAPAEQRVYRPEADGAVVGRVLAAGLADELRDRRYLVIDGIDGRSHYVGTGAGEGTAPLSRGAIVRIAPRVIAERAADRRIAAVAAAHGGRYSVELHRAQELGASAAFVEAHVRRLEAVRRSVGGVERSADGSWTVPSGYGELARRHETLRARSAPVEVQLLSPVPLERLAAHDGATWLDRELACPSEQVRDAGFGREVRSALALRRTWLIEQGFGSIEDGAVRWRADMIAVLERRELARTAAAIARETGLGFAPAEQGARVEGIVRRRLDLASGCFAMIDNGRDFSLVPWRPVLERALGRQVSGMVRAGGAISWTIGRERGIQI